MPARDRANASFEDAGALASKQALSAEHGVSRVTVRCALGALGALGRGAGARPPIGLTGTGFAANGEAVEHLSALRRPDRYPPGMEMMRRTAAGERHWRVVPAGPAGREHSRQRP